MEMKERERKKGYRYGQTMELELELELELSVWGWIEKLKSKANVLSIKQTTTPPGKTKTTKVIRYFIYESC